MADETTYCRNPDPDKQGTNIPTWKYELVRGAILGAVEGSDEGVEFRRLADVVRGCLTPAQTDALGSVSWHTTVVKLHLEAVGEIERIANTRPQRVRIANAR